MICEGFLDLRKSYKKKIDYRFWEIKDKGKYNQERNFYNEYWVGNGRGIHYCIINNDFGEIIK